MRVYLKKKIIKIYLIFAPSVMEITILSFFGACSKFKGIFSNLLIEKYD
jgi:hypothetical protein